MSADKSVQLAINTIRSLAIDAIQKANSGHPGTPLDAAPTAYTLWQQVLRYDPDHPNWLNRDRFVLSGGHASMLLYALIHLTGIKAANPSYEKLGREAVSLDDIKNFRQAGSRCPGHPEYGWTSGVESTTGPLGQGLATSVGMAIAGRWLAETYNRPGYDLFDFNVYSICGDGDMMEGISSEAASVAGHLRLSNLCWIYDSNRVTIEGHTGYGAPHKQDSPSAHGEPLGPEEVRLTKEFFGFSPDETFVVPAGVREHFAATMGARGSRLFEEWQQLFARYRAQYPDLADQIECLSKRELPPDWEKVLPTYPPSPAGMATRDVSGKVLNALAEKIPWLIGGSADLAPSNKTRLTFEFAGDFQRHGSLGNYRGRNLHFGIREHAMCAIVNGLALSGLRAFGSGFLIFTDYARGAIRLSSLMDLPVLHIWTHDSISVGEDGPTHQPIEQLISLRAIPGMVVIRPADANEVVEAYRLIFSLKNRPAALICSRQALPIFDRTKFAPANGLAKGGYVLADAPDGKPDVILIGCGSEVSLCVQTSERLTAEGIKTRVVSMPAWELFDEQDQQYQDSVLPPSVTARVTVEEASPIGWERYAGRDGVVLGMRTFGMSAPMKIVAEHFCFTPGHVATVAKEVLARCQG